MQSITKANRYHFLGLQRRRDWLISRLQAPSGPRFGSLEDSQRGFAQTSRGTHATQLNQMPNAHELEGQAP
jgi:hypothetical protein